MSFYDKFLEQFFRKKVAEHEFSFDPSSWEKMEAILDTNPTTTPLHRSPRYITFMAASVLIIFLSLYYSQTRKQTISQNEANPQVFSPQNSNSPANIDEFRISEAVSYPLFIDFQAKEDFLRLGDWMDKLWNNVLPQSKSLVSATKPNELSKFSQTISDKVKNYQDYLSEEKVYLHLDRTYFQSGENVWFQVFVRDAVTLLPSNKSNVVYVQLINNSGTIKQTRSLVVKDGIAKGDFNLKYKENGGKFKVRAFTNWQRNRNEYFERVIHIEKETSAYDFNFQFDKSSYQAGDSARVLVILKNSSTDQSGKTINYFVTVNDKKLVSNSVRIGEKGETAITFTLPPSFATFEGILNVEIAGTKKRFVKVIPGGCKNIDLQFMPEGGDLINGYETNIAFKAVNQFGSAVDINGEIYNSKGKKVTTFTTYHSGMGGFSFVPVVGEAYYAKITGPDKIEEKYLLPKVLFKGYSLKVVEKKKNGLNIMALAPNTEEAIIVVRAAGKIISTKTVDLVKGWTEIEMETLNWPSGINQITLFDQYYTPQSERLVFVNKNDLPSISIESDKEIYLPKEKVSLKVKVKDTNNKPITGQFSLAVVNKALTDFSNDLQGHILSYMLLESALQGEIENPNFYFNETEPKAEKALDYLMLTNGYRRFSWVELENEPQIALNFPGESSIIKGQILDPSNHPVPNAIVEVANTSIRKIADEEGNFLLADLDLSNAIQLNISAKGYQSNWHQVFMYYDDLKLGLNEYPDAIRDLTNYPEGFVPPMYPTTAKVVRVDKTIKEILKTQEKETKVVVVEPKFKTVKKEVQVESGTSKKPAKFKEIEEKQLVENASTELVTVPASYDTITKKVDIPNAKQNSKKAVTTSVSYQSNDWRLVKDKNLNHPNFKSIKGNFFKKAYKEQKARKVYRITKKSISTPATNRIKIIPAEYKTVVRKELVKPETLKEIIVDAEYNTVSNKVLISEATDDTPAVYDTIKEKVLVKPAYTTMVTIPAEYKEIEEKVETAPAKKISISKPAEYNFYQENVTEEEFNSYARKFKYGFYRARSFYTPKYKKDTKTKTKDHRNTLYWQPNLQLNKNGEATLEFYNSDDLGTFAVTMEGISNNGSPCRGRTDFKSRVPVILKTEIPSSMKVGDLFTLPISISNNLEQTVTGTLDLEVPKGFKLKSSLLEKYSLEGLSNIDIPVTFEVIEEISGNFLLGFNCEGFEIKKENYIEIHDNFYNILTHGGHSIENSYTIKDVDLNKKDIALDLRIYPNDIADLIDVKQRWKNQTNIGLEDEIATTELNVLALERLAKKENPSASQSKIFKQGILEQIRRLSNFKHSSGGYFWDRPNIQDAKASALIYGTLYRASKFVAVDQKEMDQLLDWILENSTKKGRKVKGYLSNDINYSLSILKEVSCNADIASRLATTINQIHKKANTVNNIYTNALLANVLLKNNDQRGNDILVSILDKQQSNGSWLSKSSSMFNKTGRLLTLETTALMLENIKLSSIGLEYKGVGLNYLSKSQFLLDGNPNYTYVKVKEALLENHISESLVDQEFTLLINGKTVASEKVNSSQRITKLERYLTEKENTIELKFQDSGLSHRIELRAKNQLETSSSSKIDIQFSSKGNKYVIDQLVNERLVAQNTTDKVIPNPILILEIPSGFSFPNLYIDQLSQNERIIRNESKDGKLILYLESMEPGSKISLPISFLPKMIGSYKNTQFSVENADELLGLYTIKEVVIE